MTKQLESLSAFQSKSINQIAMSKVLGGNAPQCSGSGTLCVPTAVSSTGCISYTSDPANGSGGYEYVGSTDVSTPC
jgi:hypothetical protein